jgi:hypothetical protein
MDFVLATRLKQGGTELRAKKQKDADVSEEAHYFKVKEIGTSIVMERTAELADFNGKKQTSRYGWASVEEVTKVLNGLKGETTDALLFRTIAGNHGLDMALVRDQLRKNDGLTFLRPTEGVWKIPVQEHDL